MKNLIQNTIEKIKKQRIAPEPKWKYLAKKYGMWLAFVFALVLVAASFSVAYENAYTLDWDLYRFLHQSAFVYFLSVIPYFWVILIAILLAFAFFEIRKTETGYRYSRLKIFAITAGSVMILGALILFSGFGWKLYSTLENNFPDYSKHLMVTKESQWMQPEKGFLAGTITSASNNVLEIDDLNGKGWNILIDEKTSIRPSVDISQKETIKIIGTEQNENNFKAEEIRPWTGNRMRNGANNNKGKSTNGNAQKGGKMRGN